MHGALPMREIHEIAVLTGDLIRSSDAPGASVDRAMQDLRLGAADIARWTGGDTRFTRFRGDGWQIVLSRRPDLALRAAIFLHARLRARKEGLQTRIAVAEGAAQSLGTGDLSDAAGPAFTLSGHALDEMKGRALLMVAPRMTPLHLGFLDLLGPLMARWTPEQAEALGLALPPDPPRQKDIASLLQISDQAVSLRLRGAHEDALRSALRHWEQDRQHRHD